MIAIKHLFWKNVLRIIVGALLLAAASSAAWAQVVQNVTVGFAPAGGGVTVGSSTPVPLSDWLTAGIALAVALTALIALRRRNLRGGRLFGFLIVGVAAATIFGVTGQRIISEAHALAPVAILDLSISPSVNIGALIPNVSVQVNVHNTTGQSVTLTSITLDAGPYGFGAPLATPCNVGTVLANGAICQMLFTEVP